MIKRIKITGLRGKNLDLNCDPLTIVIGANKAGKTTIADAIRWGLLGYIPGMDKPPRGWGELIGNGASEVMVDLEFDRGGVSRKLWLEKGSPKIDSWAVEHTEVNVLCLDPAEFLDSPGPRQATLVAEATNSSFDWKAVVPQHLAGPDLKNWGTWPAWMNMALEGAKQSRSNWALNKKTLTATLRGLEGLRGVVIEDDAAIKARLDAGKEALGSLKEQLRAVTIQIATVKDAPNPQQQLDRLLRSMQDFVGMDHDADTIEARRKDLEKRTKEWKAREKDQPILEPQRALVVGCQRDVDRQTARFEQLSVEAKKLEQKYKELKKLKRCPTCGSHGKGLTEALQLAENAETRRLADEVRDVTKASEQAKADLEKAAKQLEAAEEWYEQGVKLEEEELKLSDESKLIKLWQEHDELVTQASEQTQQYDIQGLEQRRYDIECEMQDQEEQNQQIELELNQISYKRGQRRQLEEVERELEKAETGWEHENKSVKQLEELRDRLTAMSLGSILGVLEKFTKGIFAEPLSLEGTELGRMIGSRWVPLSQFSGSEQAVAVAALSCALRGDPDAENLVLADELSSFDDQHLSVFLGNVEKAIKAGVLDQFIGFTTPRKSTTAITKNINTLRTVTL